jgi:hypothetical protein
MDQSDAFGLAILARLHDDPGRYLAATEVDQIGKAGARIEVDAVHLNNVRRVQPQ